MSLLSPASGSDDGCVQMSPGHVVGHHGWMDSSAGKIAVATGVDPKAVIGFAIARVVNPTCVR